MLKKILAYLKKQSFKPDYLSIFINPFYFIRRELYRSIKKNSPSLTGRLMDFGAGRKPYRSLFQVAEYVGVDMAKTGHDHSHSEVDVFYDGVSLPFENGHFDSILCTEVIEHVFDPEKVLPELLRVLKSGGKLLLTVPFCWNEHEIPFDYARYSSFGIIHLLEKHGFAIIKADKSGNFCKVIVQLWALYFHMIFKKWGKFGYAISLIFIAPINLLSALLLPLFPVDKSLYFNIIILAEKP